MARKLVKKKPQRSAAPRSTLALLIATRKGAFILKSDALRRSWKLSAPINLGQICQHMVLDPRDRRTMLLAAKTGHLGPTMYRSTDAGRKWHEVSRPPAFRKAAEGEVGRVLDHVFWLTPGHASEPGVWYAGTSPQGVLRSEDGGETWEPLAGLNDHPEYVQWMGNAQDGTPDGPKLHSILVDPRDPNHLYLGMSAGGIHESTDRGATWKPLVGGLEVVEQLDPTNIQFHDPHHVVFSADPDRLYQQNHCGIYRLDRPSEQWVRIGKSMPKTVGDVGFPIEPHPRDPDTAWVFPMDGTGVWPRTSPGGKPAAYVTRNGGKTWKRLDGGFPSANAWWTVKRQAMAADKRNPVGLYVGTTQGEVWGSRDKGGRWNCIARHLPEIYAVETAEIG